MSASTDSGETYRGYRLRCVSTEWWQVLDAAGRPWIQGSYDACERGVDADIAALDRTDPFVAEVALRIEQTEVRR